MSVSAASTSAVAARQIAAAQLAARLPIQSGAEVLGNKNFLSTNAYDTAAPKCDRAPTARQLPTATTLWETPLADVNQGPSNACSAMAFAQAYSTRYAIQNGSTGAYPPQLSAAYAYYYQRVQECKTQGFCKCPTCGRGNSCTDLCAPPCVDCGSYLASAQAVFELGVCSSRAWPNTRLLTPVEQDAPPDDAARADAANYRITGLRCLDVTAADVAAEVAEGHPVVLFLNLSQAQLDWLQSGVHYAGKDADGFVMPAFSGRGVAGHAVLVRGFVAEKQLFRVRNSYGAAWGVGGSFSMRVADIKAPGVNSATSVVSVQ